MDRLDPHSLEVFQAVAETGSATLAAQRLNLTQPTITRAIAQLEQATGLTLFERGRFGMRPTAEGAMFAKEVRRSLSGLERLAASARAIRQGVRGRIVVGAIPVYAEGFVARAVGRLIENAPDVDVHIDIDTPQDMLRKVLHGQVELSVLAGSFADHPEFEAQPLGQRRLMAVMRHDHPLASRGEVGTAELAGTDIVLLADPNPHRALVMQVFATAGLPMRPRLEVVTQRGAAWLALSSGTVALIDQEMATELVRLDPNVSAATFTAAPPWDVVAIRSRSRSPTLLGEALMSRLREAAAEVPGP
ncbi:MAG TPA: LysR family transcriptional regulator [Caulobacter sp.]|nr:LysR family transcriptional regulator [Caulobacter sp.]